jgi:hypothetical protein
MCSPEKFFLNNKKTPPKQRGFFVSKNMEY